MEDAAQEERFHDEPFGCTHELHRIDEVAFGVDGQPDGVVEQDERDDEQCAAEQQQDEVELVDVGADLFHHGPLVDHLIDAVPGGRFLLEPSDVILVGVLCAEFHLVGIGQRVEGEELHEVASDLLLEVFGGHRFGDEGHLLDCFVRTQRPAYLGGTFVGDLLLEHQMDGYVLLHQVGGPDGVEDQVTDASQ